VQDKLDYLKSFGVNTIYFNPIFLSPSNHRYDGSDYRTIDPSLGDLALFQQFVADLHKHGMKLILDMVPNHTSSDSIYFDRFGRYPEVGACESVDSPYRSWFYFRPASPAGSGVCAGDTNYEAWFGVETLPKVNTTDNPAVREFWMRDADATAKFWLNNGADGYRVDVANEIAPSFFTEWRPILRATKPDVVTYSEAWSEGDVRPLVLGDKFDSTMNYRFSVALLGFLRDTPFSDNDGNLALTPLKPSEFEGALRAIQEDYPEPTWSVAMNLLDSHDTNRAVVKLDHDGISGSGANRTPVNGFTDGKNRLKVVAILQYTLPGAPTIYYGDEVGLAGFGSDVPRDDPYNRQPYPWADEPGYSDLPAWRQADATLLAHYQKMGQIRTQYSFFRTGSWNTVLADDKANALAYGRRDDTGLGLVVINRAQGAQTITLKVTRFAPNGLTFTDVLNGGSYTVVDNLLSVPVNGLWGAVLVHEGAVPLPPAPTGLKAVEGDGAVTLSWNAVPGANSYLVWRSYLSGGGYQVVGRPTGASYTDTKVENGRRYYYVVRAVIGTDGADSAEVEAIPHHTVSGLLLQWPPSVSHTIAAGQPTETIYARVRVKFVTGQPGATDGLWMQIGYGLAGTAPAAWTTWQEMTFNKDYGQNGLKEWEEWMGQLWPDATGRYTYLVRVSPTAGRDWFYGGFRSGTAWGGILNVVPSADTTPPLAPINLRVTGTTPSSISLAWNPNAESDLWGYELYRVPVPTAAGGGPPWTRVATIAAGTNAYVDRDVSTGMTYAYYVMAVDTSYNRSDPSNQVEATAEARIVRVTFNVTVPAFTPAVDVVYLPGNQPELGPWNPGKWAMTKVDATHWTTTVEFLDGLALEYKYTRGTWDVVEWWEEIHDLINRHLTVDYGTNGTQTVNDTVPNWRDPLVVSTTPALGATGVPTSTVLAALFSRAVRPEDLDAARFGLSDGVNPVPGTAAFDPATLTATFTPAAALAPNTTYTWTIGPGLRGDAGSSMQSGYVVTFTTAP
jgi:glycosidase